MSESRRSFFSTIPGLVTGLAGLLTGIVGLVTVLIQLGVIGDDGDDSPVTGAGTTVVPGAPGGGGGVATTEVGRLTVSPTLVKIQGTQRDAEVKVTNQTRTTKVTVLTPEFDGPDQSVFRADAGCSNVPLDPGRSCTLKVLFSPSGPLKSYRATLVVKGDRGTPDTQVPVEASSLL
jgi:hypothetical protein